VESDLLRTFTAVVRTGSFTAAARELGFVQSTVTGHLQALERRLGTRLLDRLASGAVPTDAGSRLLPYAEQLLELETRIATDVPDSDDDRPRGRVRVVAPESLCAYRLPDLLARLRTNAPGVRLALTPAGTASALAAVRAGTAETALLLEPTLTAADLHLEQLGAEELTLLAAPDAPNLYTSVQSGQELAWAELAQQDALLLEDGCSYSDDVARQLLAAGQPESRRIRFGSVEAVKRCTAAGLGWTVLPEVTAAAELSAGSLTALPAPLPSQPVVHLATHPDRTLSVATRVVGEHLRALWQPAR
jgi:DNA-binding transcriptional LysR family regulator